MKKTLTILCATLLFAVAAAAQKEKPAKPYSITAIKIVSFDEINGKFGDEVTKETFFGNDLSTSLFATIELTGGKGDYASNRNVQLTVTQGKRVKQSRLAMPGILNDDGHYYIPLWIYGPICDDLKITASVTGQTKVATMSRTVSAHCGE